MSPAFAVNDSPPVACHECGHRLALHYANVSAQSLDCHAEALGGRCACSLERR